MRRPTCAVLSLLLLCPSLIAAAPHDSVPSHHDPSHTPRPWRKLSDAIIRKVWGLPDAQKSLPVDAGAARGTPGRDVVARYRDDVVLRFTITTPDEADALADAADVLFLDVWEFNSDWVDIRIAKDVLPSLLGLLPPSLQTAHVPLMQHLELAQAIFSSYPAPSGTQPHADDDSYSPNLKPSPRLGGKGHPFFQDYQPLSVINPWMSLMASMFTTHVRRIHVGVSYEGRDIPALRVGVHPTNAQQRVLPRRTVLIVGGSHAREWISTSTVNYLAWTLINSYGKDREITRLLEQFDFVFVPTLNPDGYVYSWETDRLWRKNRQPTSLRFCKGIDLDRSYAFQWDGDAKPTNPCSESFPGDAPFAGIEAQRFADWARNETDHNNVEFVGFFDLHSYSQQILYPYSYTCDEEPPAIEDLEELAMGLAKAIRTSRRGHAYKVTSACEGNVALTGSKKKIFPRIESAGGSALDWFYHELKVKYSFQIKLRDTGSYGFLLPRDNIVPTGNEVLEAVLYLGRFMLGEVGVLEGAPSRDVEGGSVAEKEKEKEGEQIEL
ncbi:putative metallocarboxypeptidase ECM14 [Karstenula rhodostoma CBS 690.94]|uniref:Inactive metallocarboxypeptidase ECM14 n=1 Tax=Karstenula rhodostoma CBS 690.94 TaxID=1392251 RepID=A0A9P4PRU5_9PLEO|nr:putative metallocarboxypeptidase ECM14 [Karstenula rhodostoma CBS 690.94]